MGQKHQAFREFRKPFPRATSANDVRVPHMMAQFVLKIGELSHIIGTAPMARLRSPSPIMAPGVANRTLERLLCLLHALRPSQQL